MKLITMQGGCLWVLADKYGGDSIISGFEVVTIRLGLFHQ
jgi:hypothetical protein